MKRDCVLNCFAKKKSRCFQGQPEAKLRFAQNKTQPFKIKHFESFIVKSLSKLFQPTKKNYHWFSVLLLFHTTVPQSFVVVFLFHVIFNKPGIKKKHRDTKCCRLWLNDHLSQKLCLLSLYRLFFLVNKNHVIHSLCDILHV